VAQGERGERGERCIATQIRRLEVRLVPPDVTRQPAQRLDQRCAAISRHLGPDWSREESEYEKATDMACSHLINRSL
jgi:hypothetical protein